MTANHEVAVGDGAEGAAPVAEGAAPVAEAAGAVAEGAAPVAEATVGNATQGGGGLARPALRIVSVLLLAGLGFGLAVMVRSADPADRLGRLRPDELAAELENLSVDGQRLQDEAGGLRATQSAIADGARGDADIDRARQEADALAVLAGTSPATGPGVTLTINDPRGTVEAWILVDALQELRDAGTEAIELSGVRVVASTYIVDAPGGGMTVDGGQVAAPYVMRAIGDAHTLAQAMRIPGGVLDTVATRDGAQAEVANSERIEIRALRTVPSPRFARPAD